MGYRKWVVPGFLVGILIFVAFFAAASVLQSKPAQAQSEESATSSNASNAFVRQVTVVGVGEVEATPDTVHVQIGVETEDETAQSALAQNNLRTTDVISSLKQLDIDEKDIQTSNFSIHSTYDEKGREVTGYRVSNTVAVKVRNIDEDDQKAGQLLDEVVQVGANSIYGINFSVEDPTELLEQAREAAMDNAKAKAQQLATAGDASVGRVLVITENIGEGQQPIMPRGLGGAMAMEEAASVPVQAGQQTFSVRVQVTFELE